MSREYIDIEELKGKVFSQVFREGDDSVVFICEDETRYEMYHEQDCCEGVYLEDIAGELEYLIGTPITMAEEVSNSDDPPLGEYTESYTWTYYKFATSKGYVTIRWYGE